MPLISDNTFKASLRNISRWGDTDVFPYPIENHVIHDSEDDLVEVLQAISLNFNEYIVSNPVVNHSELAPVGYMGFRWATQIDPLWNVYLLALVLKLAPEIEAARISREQEIIYSYRYEPKDDAGIFWPDAWKHFQERSRALAEQHAYVLTADISDFYPRIYHHRLENALQSVDASGSARQQIMAILGRLSNGTSYGLPVGGSRSAPSIRADTKSSGPANVIRRKGVVL